MLPPGARRLGAAALAYAVLALIWAAPSSLSPRERVPDLGDPLHLAWVMAWDAHQLVRRPFALFDANAFYPYRNSLAFADHLLPEALLVAPLFWATGNAVLGYNVALLLALVLSALAMFLLLRGLGVSDAAAFLGGVVYAFNSFTLHEVPRVHVLSVPWWPLALLALDRFAREGRPRDAALLAALLLLQGLSGTYYLAYTALLAPVWLALAFAVARRRPRRREVQALGLSLALAAGAALLVLWPYFGHFRALGFEKSWAGGADLLAYVTPEPRNWLWAGLLALPARSELPHFVGVAGGALMLAGAGLVLRRGVPERARLVGAVAVATAAIGLILSLGPLVHVGGRLLGPGPYGLLYRYVPLFRGMAGPERVSVLVVLGGAALAGLALDALLRAAPRAGRAALTAALAVLLPLEHWGPPRPPGSVPAGRDVPEVYSWLAREGGGPLVELPLYPLRARKLWAAYLYFSTYHWRPIPIGRTSFYPPAHEWLAWGLRDFPGEVSLALLERLAIRTVVVHPRLWPESERADRLDALRAQPRLAPRRAFASAPPPRFDALGLGQEEVLELTPAALPTPPCVPADEVARGGWTFGSTGVNKPERVRDGDRGTAWMTAIPQRPGDRLEVDLVGTETLAAVAVDIGYPHEEFARNLVLAVDGGDGWQRVAYDDGPAARLATLDDLLERPQAARMVLRFAPRPARRLRLMVGLREEDPAWPRWSVPELRLFRACR